MSNESTEGLLREMRGLITERLYNALTNPDKPPRASTIQAAIAWMRLTGNVEDPDARKRERDETVARSLAGLPFPAFDKDDDRRKLADAVQHAVETMGDQGDDESEDF